MENGLQKKTENTQIGLFAPRAKKKQKLGMYFVRYILGLSSTSFEIGELRSSFQLSLNSEVSKATEACTQRCVELREACRGWVDEVKKQSRGWVDEVMQQSLRKHPERMQAARRGTQKIRRVLGGKLCQCRCALRWLSQVSARTE